MQPKSAIPIRHIQFAAQCSQSPYSLYIHIPTCANLCPYCDFAVSTQRNFPWADYVQAIQIQWARWSDSLASRPLQTIYFGGGTPSLMPAALFCDLLTELIEETLGQPSEVAVEVDPRHVADGWLERVLAAGINRISIGAQSFQPEVLKKLGRGHSHHAAQRAPLIAKELGCNNVSIDLIFAAPNQTMAMLEADLEIIESLPIEHVSGYHLTVEPNTAFEKLQQKGKLPLPAEDLQLEQFKKIRSGLHALGFNAYEISNFSRPGYESLHNQSYWNGADYIGLGTGAHASISDGTTVWRWSQHRSLEKYIESVHNNPIQVDMWEHLMPQVAAGEAIFVGLRNAEGVNLKKISDQFGLDVEAVYATKIKNLVALNYVEQNKSQIALTLAGIEVSNWVFEQFIHMGK